MDEITAILFRQVLDGLLNCEWNEKVDPPIPMFSLTKKGVDTVENMFDSLPRE